MDEQKHTEIPFIPAYIKAHTKVRKIFLIMAKNGGHVKSGSTVM